MREVHPMNGNRGGNLLRHAAAMLAVTAASYGVEPPARAQRWASAGRVGPQQPFHGVDHALEGNGFVQHRHVQLPEIADVRG